LDIRVSIDRLFDGKKKTRDESKTKDDYDPPSQWVLPVEFLLCKA